jgi:hypothetical protein
LGGFRSTLEGVVPGLIRSTSPVRPDVHDLVLAKLVRNSPVDLEDAEILVKAGQLDEDISKGRQENCSLISPTNPDMTLR